MWEKGDSLVHFMGQGIALKVLRLAGGGGGMGVEGEEGLVVKLELRVEVGGEGAPQRSLTEPQILSS
jgi:hypothetical protein